MDAIAAAIQDEFAGCSLEDVALGDEQWRPVPDAPRYSVSTQGQVKGPSGRILKPRSNSQGYVRINIGIGFGRSCDRYVHEMVLATFRGPRPSEEHQADHRDDNRANNSLRNLRWLTATDNRSRRRITRGEERPQAKLTEFQIRAIRAEPKNRTSAAIARDYGVSRRQISDIRRGISWRHVQ
jgi:hypothetical protein